MRTFNKDNDANRSDNSICIKWIDIPGYNGYYKINKLGEVLNTIRNRTIGNVYTLSQHEYPKVTLVNNGVRKSVRIHRIMASVFLLPVGDYQVDHKDGNRHNNKLENLRICNNQLNNANKLKYNKKLSSIYKGVSYDKFNKKFRANINIDGKSINLGRFKNEVEAAKIYDKFALIFFGDFANLNFK